MIPLYEKCGFIICFEALPEEVGMKQHFVKECGWSEKHYRALSRKGFEWFCAKISAWRDGEELGAAYLGCCCYDSHEDFYLNSDYLPQMVEEAIDEAEQTLIRKMSE